MRRVGEPRARTPLNRNRVANDLISINIDAFTSIDILSAPARHAGKRTIDSNAARYFGTAAISITRAGRRPCPGQYALPYIR